MMHTKRIFTLDILAAIVALQPCVLSAGPTTLANPPSECSAPNSTCGCSDDGDYGARDDGTDGETGGNDGDNVENGCIKVRLGLGRTTPWTGSLACSLKIFADDDAPEIFTAESLHAVLGGYTFKRLGQGMLSDGATPAEVVFSHPNGESVAFVFAEGESRGRPAPGVHRDMDERLMMADAEGWATAADPVYYDLYVGDGTRRRFLATDATGRRGALVSITDARGVTNTPEEMGIDIVYDINGVRQFLTPSRLADVTHTPDWSGYDVAVYALGADLPAKDPATGLYALPPGNPSKRLSVRRADGGKRAVVTIRRGGDDPLVHVFDYAMGEWSLTRPSGVREEKERMIADSRAAQIVSTVREPSGDRLSRRESNYQWMSWGFAMTNRIEGFGGVTETTAWTYHASGNGSGQVATERRQSGLLVQYAYDALDRIVTETRSGPGMMTLATSYAYASVDPADVVPPVDKRPRTVTRTLDGIECERTYYVYSPLTNVVERVGAQGAAYGGTNALRTVTAYWPVVDNDIRSGFVASIRRENGALDFYDYALASNLWTRTVTHLHELSPEPVDGRTTRDIMVTNRRGETVETRTEAYVQGAWRVVARSQRSFNAEGRIVRRENLAGQVTATVWDCCHKVSETQPDGSVTTWDYDVEVEGRMTASSRLIPLDMTNVTWLTTCHEYDGLGRQTAMWQTNYVAQVGTPATRTVYDALGRVSKQIDVLGNATTTAYDADGIVVTTTAPNGATTIQSRNPNGGLLSLVGSAVTPQFDTYGILPDGARWMRSVQGESPESPRFTKRFENMLGQTIREERSGFLGAVLATTHEYDGYGRLARTIADGEPTTEYTYDILGARVSTCRSAGGPSASWRRATTHTSFTLLGDAIWQVATNTVSCSDASITPLVTTSAEQLSGLAAALPARSRTTDVRGNVSETTLAVSAQTTTTTMAVPYSTNAQRSRSRYGVELQTISVSCVTNTYAYDVLGRQVSVTDGRGNTTRTEYDAVGRQSAAIDALGNRTTYAYDQFGNLASVTDPLGNATVYEYDLRGNKTYEGGATYPVRYTYDVFGRMATLATYRDESLAPDSGDVTTWLYDEASGAMTNKVYADGVGPTYDYTPNGRLSRRTWARGTITDYSYDGWGNLTNTVYSDDTPTISLAYDAMGRMASAVVEGVSTNAYSYSAYGELTNEVQNGVSIARNNDAFGRPSGYTLCDSVPLCEVNYSYDALGRFAAVDFNAETQSGRVEYGYLPGTVLVAGYTSGDFSRSVTYEPQRNLIASVSNTFGSTLISAFDYANDAAGRRVSRIDTFNGAMATNVFGYNVRSEVTSAAMGTNTYGYAYDPIGNRITSSHNDEISTYTANALNQYTAIDEARPTYDADGNMTADGNGWHYVWNGENRMVCASNDEVVVTYAYDHHRRMVRKNISHGDTTTQRFDYLWDDWNIIREIVREGDSVAVTDNVWGLDLDGTLQGAGGVGGLLAVIRSNSSLVTRSSSLYFPAYDANGNVTEYVATDGDIVAHYNYSPFGEPIDAFNAFDTVFTHMFSSKPYCSITEFCEYQMRKYIPKHGQWVIRDPLGTVSGVNEYILLTNCRRLATWDYLGLLENEEACKSCNDVKMSWEQRKKATEAGIPNPWWDFYVDLFNTEGTLPKISITCQKNEIYGDGWSRLKNSMWSGKNCTIVLGCDACRHPAPQFASPVEDFSNALVHELTHCVQFTQEGRTKSCEEALCREIQAYYRGTTDQSELINDPRNLIAIAWSSTYDSKNCKGHTLAEYMPTTEEAKTEFVRKCVGNLSPPIVAYQ